MDATDWTLLLAFFALMGWAFLVVSRQSAIQDSREREGESNRTVYLEGTNRLLLEEIQRVNEGNRRQIEKLSDDNKFLQDSLIELQQETRHLKAQLQLMRDENTALSRALGSNLNGN